MERNLVFLVKQRNEKQTKKKNQPELLDFKHKSETTVDKNK